MITTYISELLYEHNCVILPGFGGFIANRLPSKVNEAQQRVEPPRKVVVFNVNLSQNDGLLADHISKADNISFDLAAEQIRNFVDELRTELNLKRNYTLKGIGDFFLNMEDKIVFIPEADINFAKETYGLFPVSIRRIIRVAEDTLVIEKEIRREKPLPAPKPRVQRNRKWVYGTLLVTLPLLFGIVTQQTGVLQRADFSIGNIFKREATPVKTEHVQPEKPAVENPKVEEKKTEAPVTTLQPVPEVTKTNEPAPTVASPATGQATADYHFHIIGGSFAVPSNAENFLKSLQSKGYNAYIAGTNPVGLQMISYKGFTSPEEAATFLQTIRQTENAQAWMLNK
jgi:cell division septation protein DedD